MFDDAKNAVLIRIDLRIAIALVRRVKWPQVGTESNRGDAMISISAKDAKYWFGHLIDLVRSEPVVIEKHGRQVVIVMAV